MDKLSRNGFLLGWLFKFGQPGAHLSGLRRPERILQKQAELPRGQHALIPFGQDMP